MRILWVKAGKLLPVDTGGKKLWHCSADGVASLVDRDASSLHSARRDLPCRPAQQRFGLVVLGDCGHPAEEVQKNRRDRLVDSFVRADCGAKLSHHGDVAVIEAGHRVVVPGGDQLQLGWRHGSASIARPLPDR